MQNLESRFIRDVIKLSVAVEIKNISWAKKNIINMIGWGPEELTFGVQRYSYGRTERLEKFKDILNHLDSSSQSLIKDKFLSKAFSDRVDELLNDGNGDVYKPRGRNWLLADIWKKLYGTRVHGRIWGYFFQKLLDRTSLKEASLLLKRKMDKDFIEKMNFSEIWLFNHYYPPKGILSKVALNKIHSAWETGNLWFKYLVIKLIENPVVKKELAKKEPSFKRALFQIERHFYRRLLLQGTATDFALYNLMRLGDYNRQNLWWLAF